MHRQSGHISRPALDILRSKLALGSELISKAFGIGYRETVHCAARFVRQRLAAW